MSTAPASKLKDLVVTATVATVVSALVSPWVRRWLEGPLPLASVPTPTPTSADDAGVPQDDSDEFNARVERLLDVRNPFTAQALGNVEAEPGKNTDEEDDDDE